MVKLSVFNVRLSQWCGQTVPHTQFHIQQTPVSIRFSTAKRLPVPSPERCISWKSYFWSYLVLSSHYLDLWHFNLKYLRLRSASSPSLVVRRTQLSTYSNRAFPVAASRVWNSLPHKVTSAQSPPVFCSRLKDPSLDAVFLDYTVVTAKWHSSWTR